MKALRVSGGSLLFNDPRRGRQSPEQITTGMNDPNDSDSAALNAIHHPIAANKQFPNGGVLILGHNPSA